MFKLLLTAIVLMLSTPVLAEVTAQRDSEFENSVCYNHHRDARTCSNLWYCEFDYRTSLCNYVDDDRTSRSCESYDYDPYLCNTQDNCSYDSYSRRCRDSYNPGPGPGHNQCWQYSNNPRQCNDTYGCSYDRNSRTCQDDFQPDPDPITTQTVTCNSSRYAYQNCPVRGEIVSAHILRQTSRSQCVEGRTWGYDYNGLWVDQGCQATFKVRVRRGWN
jgi:hypothetical protein